MRTAIMTLLAVAVLGKYRAARIQDLLNGINLPDTNNIVETLKPHADKIDHIAREEA